MPILGGRKKPLPASVKDQSAGLVQIVGVFYAVVLGDALLTNGPVVLHPLARPHRLAALALVLVAVGAAALYLRLSLDIQRMPYDVKFAKGRPWRALAEEARFAVDLITAASFAVLLAKALSLAGTADRSLSELFLVLVVINGLDLASTLLQRLSWKLPSSRKSTIWTMAALVLLFWPLFFHLAYGSGARSATANLWWVGAALASLVVREVVQAVAAWQVFGVASFGQPPAVSQDGGVYVAGPLGFSDAGRTYLYDKLYPLMAARGLRVLDPWHVDPAATAVLEARPDVDPAELLEVSRQIGERNVALIDSCDAVLALLDGSDVDSGTAAEIGYAAAKGKRVIGLRLDTRVSGDNEGVTVNLQVEHFLANRDQIARGLETAIEQL